MVGWIVIYQKNREYIIKKAGCIDMEYCYCVKWKRAQHNTDKKYNLNVQGGSEKWVQMLEKIKREKIKIKYSILAASSLFHLSSSFPIFAEEKVKIGQNRERLMKKEAQIEKNQELEIKKEENCITNNMLDGVIELPFQKNDMEYISEKTIKEYMNRLKLHLAKKNQVAKEQIHFLTSDRQLKNICKETTNCEWLLKLLLFLDILEKVQLENHLDIAKAKIGLLDSENGITEYLLKILINQCIFLTIFTKEGHFE